MKVVIYCQFRNPFWAIPDSSVEQLVSDFPHVEFFHARSGEQIMDEIHDADVFFGYRIDADTLSIAKRLRWIHIPAANVHGLNLLAFKHHNLTLTNARGLHAIPISEHVIGSMIVFARKYMECMNYKQQLRYSQPEILNEPPPLSVLNGKTIFILGLGSIGKEIARLSRAFGMQVIATKRNIRATDYPNVDRVLPFPDFRSALPEADYVVISLPVTAETDRVIGKSELALLKREAVLINIARARIVDQEALLDALREQRIRGAALDVFDQEPLPNTSELYSTPNVFLTPHVSGVVGQEHWPNMVRLFAENLKRFEKSEALLNVVDLDAGY